MTTSRLRLASGLRRCARGRLTALPIALAVLSLASAAPAADRMYWSTGVPRSAIKVGKLHGGTSPRRLFVRQSNASGVAIDPAAGKVYWAAHQDSGLERGVIRVGNLDGAGAPRTLFTGGEPVGVAVDPRARKIYWADITANRIRMLNANGRGPVHDLFFGEHKPTGVAIDPVAGKIYWANLASGSYASAGAIRVGNLNGSGPARTLFAGEDTPHGVAVDPAAGKIYWTDYFPNEIRVGNLDGTGSPRTLFSGQRCPWGVAVDPTAAKIYWASCSNSPIRVANLDGTGSPRTVFARQQSPGFLALLTRPQATGAPRVSGGSNVGSVLSCTRGTWAPNVLGSFFYRAPRSFHYQWSRNGTDIAGATARSHAASSPGFYRCRVRARNAAGSSAQTSAPHSVRR